MQPKITATDNGKTSKYNLCTRDPDPVNSTPYSEHPHREATKSVTYTEPTEDSSQDSQVIGTIYSMDNRPTPDAKLEKIVGLSDLLLTDLEHNPTLMQKREENYHHPLNVLCPVSKPNQTLNPKTKPVRTAQTVRQLKSMTC